MKCVVLHSGGLDSTVMYRMAKESGRFDEVIPVYFDIGHEYAWKEKQRLPPETQVFDMQWFQAEGKGKEGNAMANIFIPGRNMMFATLAACKFVPNEIWLGSLMGEIHAQATDKNLTYRFKQNNLLQYVLSPFGEVQVVFPFVDKQMGKLGVTALGISYGMKDEIEKSSSCMSGEAGSCGKCGVCLRRAGIFAQLGLEEKFNVDPWTAKENFKMILALLDAAIREDYSHYDWYRIEEIVPTLQARHPSLTLLEIKNLYENYSTTNHLRAWL